MPDPSPQRTMQMTAPAPAARNHRNASLFKLRVNAGGMGPRRTRAHTGETTAKKEALDSEDEVAGRWRLRRKDWRDRSLARIGGVACKVKVLATSACVNPVNSGVTAAGGFWGAATQQLACTTHMACSYACSSCAPALCRKNASPNRQQQHPNQGDGNRGPLADPTQHTVSLP